MSHFTEVKTNLVEKELLLKALHDLGLKVEEYAQIRGYNGIQESVEIKIPSPNPDYDIGFRRSGGVFEMVADWHGLKRFKKEDFVARLTQRYAYHATVSKLQEQGFTLAAEEQQEQGRIHLVLRRTA